MFRFSIAHIFQSKWSGSFYGVMAGLSVLTLSCTQGPVVLQKGPAHQASPHWAYAGVEDPEHWGMLTEGYKACEAGRQQSPINITHHHMAQAKEDLVLHYHPINLTVIHNEHTIQVNYHDNSALLLNGKTYKLRQLHFHDPSEHHIHGIGYPLEMHLVHQDDTDHVLVVSVLMKYGVENPTLARIGAWLKQHVGQSIPKERGQFPTGLTLDVNELLPADHHHFSYHGSLTTPPCTEGVQWIVLTNPVEISHEQGKWFADAIGANARPVQPLYNREILEQ